MLNELKPNRLWHISIELRCAKSSLWMWKRINSIIIFSPEMTEWKFVQANGRAQKENRTHRIAVLHTSIVISNAMEQTLLIFVEMEWSRRKKRFELVYACSLINERKKQSTAYESAYLLDKNLCWSDKDLEMENSCGNLQILCVFAFSPSTLHYVHREIWTAEKSNSIPHINNESSSFKGIAKCSHHSTERSKSWAVPMAFMRGDNN